MTLAATLSGAAIHEHRLRNGLRVLIAERHSDPVVAVMLWYGVGSLHEAPHEAGVSHFLEHMMFKGTARFGKGVVDRITTELGGSNNAFTSSDHTAYWFELASDRWEAALELEADRVHDLTLEPGEFEAEKAVVLEELSMGNDDPWRRLSREVQAVLFGRHPYARPVIGYADALEGLTRAQMQAYYRRHYRVDNATLVVCGDVRPGPALKAIRRHFGPLPRGEAAAPSFRPELREPLGERRLEVGWDDPAARLSIAWPGATVGTDEDFGLDLISAILTSGRLSRLYRRLVLDEGLATFVSTSNDARVEGGGFWLQAETVNGADPARLEAAVDEELARLAEETVSPAELKRAKRLLAAGEAYEAETVTDLAERIGEYATDADWRLLLEFGRRRAAVRRSDVRRLAARLLQRRRRVLGWSLPEERRG